MKHGILFFFHMGRITTIARLIVVPSFLLIWRVVPRSPAFWFLTLLSSAALLTAFIHAPSDKTMQNTLDRFFEDLKETLHNTYGFRSEENIVYLKGYQKKGHMILRRQLGSDIIYPYPTVFIYAERVHKRIILIVQKNLMKATPIKYTCIDLDKEKDLQIQSSSEGIDKIIEITIKCQQIPSSVTIYAKNDYHYRNFLTALSMVQVQSIIPEQFKTKGNSP